MVSKSSSKPLETSPIIVGLTPAFTQNGEPHLDGGACCIAGGQVCAVAEERLTRRKHAGGAAFALRTVLADCGVELQDVSRFYVSTCGERIPGAGAPVPLSEDSSPRLRDLGVLAQNICWVPSHHLSHAYAAFEPSPFERALVVVMDDAGSAPLRTGTKARKESRAIIGGDLERTSCFLASRQRQYELVAQVHASPPFAGGYGSMYRYVTDFLGLDGLTECGKTMALAAYGRPGALARLRLLAREGMGHVTRLAEPPIRSVEAVRALLVEAGYVDVVPRGSAGPIQRMHEDLARHTQDVLEEAVTAMLLDLIGVYGVSEVCLSGGVALNCVLAGRLLSIPEVTSLFVASAPGDTGQPLGNCLYGARQADVALPSDAVGPYIGPRYAADRVRRACEAWGTGLRIGRNNVARRVAEGIAAGRVVAIFHGRSELGPRALGHRSILADPRSPQIRDYMNDVVKRRESYRPYGASILAEETENLTGRTVDSPFMLLALPLSRAWQARLPAVCHVDGTSRIQTVSREDSRWFRGILEAFHALTGIPAVLNTSFNAAGEPIVETPEDALAAFLSMPIDDLAIEDWYLKKPTSRETGV